MESGHQDGGVLRYCTRCHYVSLRIGLWFVTWSSDEKEQGKSLMRTSYSMNCLNVFGMALIVLVILSDESGLLWQGELKAIDPATGLLQCQYTSDIATGLAAGALIFLILAQSFIMIVTRCLCCGSGYKPGAARTFGVLMFIISW